MTKSMKIGVIGVVAIALAFALALGFMPLVSDAGNGAPAGPGGDACGDAGSAECCGGNGAVRVLSALCSPFPLHSSSVVRGLPLPAPYIAIPPSTFNV